MATVPVDPSNQFGGMAKYVGILAAGWLTAKVFKGQFQVDPQLVTGVLLAGGTFVWQVAHRSKVGRAQTAAVALPPDASKSTVADTVAKA